MGALWWNHGLQRVALTKCASIFADIAKSKGPS